MNHRIDPREGRVADQSIRLKIEPCDECEINSNENGERHPEYDFRPHLSKPHFLLKETYTSHTSPSLHQAFNTFMLTTFTV